MFVNSDAKLPFCFPDQDHFIRRKYKSSAISTAINQVRNIPRDRLISYQDKKPNPSGRTPFVITYHPSLPSISSIINKHWHILTSNQSTRETFTTPPFVAYRQPPNLKKMIVKANLKTKTKDTDPGLCKPCNNCRMCNFMIKNNEHKIINKLNDKSYPLIGQLTCKTRNIIYAIVCARCNKLYIGETKRELRIRINEHL